MVFLDLPNAQLALKTIS